MQTFNASYALYAAASVAATSITRCTAEVTMTPGLRHSNSMRYYQLHTCAKQCMSAPYKPQLVSFPALHASGACKIYVNIAYHNISQHNVITSASAAADSPRRAAGEVMKKLSLQLPARPSLLHHQLHTAKANTHASPHATEQITHVCIAVLLLGQSRLQLVWCGGILGFGLWSK